MSGSGIFLARHTRPCGAALLRFAGTADVCNIPSSFPPFLKNTICGLLDTLNFIILLVRTADLVYGHEGSQSCPRCGKVTSQKLKPMVALRVESCSILKLLKRQLFCFEASEKAACLGEAQGSWLWASA